MNSDWLLTRQPLYGVFSLNPLDGIHHLFSQLWTAISVTLIHLFEYRTRLVRSEHLLLLFLLRFGPLQDDGDIGEGDDDIGTGVLIFSSEGESMCFVCIVCLVIYRIILSLKLMIV